MDLLKHENIASVTLFDMRLSESELMVYEGCIDYVINNCTDAEISQLTGCVSKEELLWFHEDLVQLIKKHVLQEYLPDKFK